MTPEQEAVLQEIVAAMSRSAPAGWLRIVIRRECSVASGSFASSGVEVVVQESVDGLTQDTYRAPRDLYWTRLDFHEDLARSAASGSVVLHLVIDRDGSHTAEVIEEAPKVLEGVRDESSSKPVHEYLDRNRAELEALAQRLR